MKIHFVFLVKSLYRDLNDLLLSQANAPLPLINVTADNKYKVQKIITIKLTKGKLTYRAK
jgi:hypothetical protein